MFRSQTSRAGSSLHLPLPAAESFSPPQPLVCAAGACEPQARCVLSPGLSVWQVRTDLRCHCMVQSLIDSVPLL